MIFNKQLMGINTNIFWVIFSSCVIMFFAGHGGAPLILMEIICLVTVISGESQLSFFGSYLDAIEVTCVFSLTGQILLIWAYFVKTEWKKRLVIIGSFCLLLGFINQTHHLGENSLAWTTFCTGIPFLLFISRLNFIMLKGNVKR
jgi:hypothetical protein